MWGSTSGVDKVVLKPVSTRLPHGHAAPGAARHLAASSPTWPSHGRSSTTCSRASPTAPSRNLGRFVVNTTIGVGGLADHATKMGIKAAPEDFGQTLASWGVNGGPYLVLPILGPSTLRDGVGMGVAQFADPYRVCLRECGLTDTQQYRRAARPRSSASAPT